MGEEKKNRELLNALLLLMYLLNVIRLGILLWDLNEKKKRWLDESASDDSHDKSAQTSWDEEKKNKQNLNTE